MVVAFLFCLFKWAFLYFLSRRSTSPTTEMRRGKTWSKCALFVWIGRVNELESLGKCFSSHTNTHIAHQLKRQCANSRGKNEISLRKRLSSFPWRRNLRAFRSDGKRKNDQFLPNKRLVLYSEIEFILVGKSTIKPKHFPELTSRDQITFFGHSRTDTRNLTKA